MEAMARQRAQRAGVRAWRALHVPGDRRSHADIGWFTISGRASTGDAASSSRLVVVVNGQAGGMLVQGHEWTHQGRWQRTSLPAILSIPDARLDLDAAVAAASLELKPSVALRQLFSTVSFVRLARWRQA